MARNIFILLFTLTCICICIARIINIDQSYYQLKKEVQKLDSLYNESSNHKTILTPSENYNIKRNILNLKKELKEIKTIFTNPIYFKNNIKLDYNLDLVDFYIYEYSENYFSAIGRIKNKQRAYLDFVKIRFDFYKNRTFIGTDFTYIDFETYGYAGISPYKYAYINTFVNKTSFDSVSFYITYDQKNGNDPILWDQILHLESTIIQPYGNYYKWQGTVKNQSYYSLKFPHIVSSIFKDDKMIGIDYTYLDVQNDSLPANSTGTFDSFIDLPDNYDKIKYSLGYSLGSLKGTGNIRPNFPIFTEMSYSNSERFRLNFEIFVIDHEKDKCDLMVDFGDNTQIYWIGPYFSGYNTTLKHSYAQKGVYYMKTKTKDFFNIESLWSDSVQVQITQSSMPHITTNKIDTAIYKKQYNLQFSASGGINPYTWKISSGQLPSGLSLVSTTGQISGIPTSSGLFNFLIAVIDNGDPSFSDTLASYIFVKNKPPLITSKDSINVFAGIPFTYTANAIDPDGNSIIFKFINYPLWSSVTQTTLLDIPPKSSKDTSFILIASDDELSDTIKVKVKISEQPTNIIDEQNIPSNFFLESNYPNPFNPITKIKIGVPKPSELKLAVYDIHGSLVKTIFQGNLNSGTYFFVWNASSYTSGTYFIRMQTPDFIKIKKCLLLK